MKKKIKPTLEKIIESLGDNFNEERVHASMLLAFAKTVYGIVRRDCVPSPLYRVSFDEANNNITVEETAGYSSVPKDVLDISDLDILIMANLREIPILFEGETGIGKTFVSKRYLSTILEERQYFSYRLSSNAFLNNLFQHFQEGKMVNGMPVIEAKKDRIETTAAGMIDEINRGDPNETLQLFDNEMHLGGVIYKLGIPIPEIKNRQYTERSGRNKPMLLISAQNPAFNEDAKFTGTMQLDAAVDNRLLKIYMDNASSSAGSTLWLGEGRGRRHEIFLQDFQKISSNYLEIKPEILEGIDNDWLSIYAWLTDSQKTDKPVLYSALELADLLTGMFSGNLIDYYNYERKVLENWDSKIKKGIRIEQELKETEKVKKLHEITSSFKVPIIFRDIVQIKKMADILATLKNIKDALKEKNPVQEYLNSKRYVTVREVAEATALVARNKQKSDSATPVPAINEVLNQYCRLSEEYMEEARKLAPSFELFDPQAGIKNVAIYRAIRKNILNSGNIDTLIEKVAHEANKLAQKISVSEEVRNIIIARSCSDLMTLCGFLQEYKKELEPYVKKYKKVGDVENFIEALGSFYCQKHREDAIIMPDIYQHRIQRTLGIENKL